MNTRYVMGFVVKRMIEYQTRYGLVVKRLSARHVLGLVVEGLIEC